MFPVVKVIVILARNLAYYHFTIVILNNTNIILKYGIVKQLSKGALNVTTTTLIKDKTCCIISNSLVIMDYQTNTFFLKRSLYTQCRSILYFM